MLKKLECPTGEEIDEYMKFLEKKYNIQEEYNDIYVKDKYGNIKLEKRLSKKIKTSFSDWEEFLNLKK